VVSGVVSEARDASAIQSPARSTKTETEIVRSGFVRGKRKKGAGRRSSEGKVEGDLVIRGGPRRD
jgi:hypothetical protein